MSDIDNLSRYDDILDKVEKKLHEYIPVIEPELLYEPFRYIMSPGGKRIRPVLTMICAGAVGGNPEDALNAGAAIEILHNFTLVHDDIMDRSAMRRNLKTIHEKWNEPTAILTGDIMVGYAYRLLPTSVESSYSNEIIDSFSKGLIEVCEGQAYDMQFNSRKNVTVDEYFLMITKKTARLIETAAVIGGYSGNGSQDQIKTLRNYANALGLAFQLQDDLLDLTADQTKLGKNIGQDIIEGKKTYMIIRSMQLAESQKDKELINQFYENNGLPLEKVKDIKDMFLHLGIMEESQNLINDYFSKADNELTKLPTNQYTEMLYWLNKRLNKRKF